MVCTRAKNAPTTIEAIDRNTMICCQSPVMSGNGPNMARTNNAIAAILGATAKKAVTGVGAPS